MTLTMNSKLHNLGSTLHLKASGPKSQCMMLKYTLKELITIQRKTSSQIGSMNQIKTKYYTQSISQLWFSKMLSGTPV